MVSEFIRILSKCKIFHTILAILVLHGHNGGQVQVQCVKMCPSLSSLLNKYEDESTLRGKDIKCQGQPDCDKPASSGTVAFFNCKPFYHSTVEFESGQMKCEDGKWSNLRDFTSLQCVIECGIREQAVNSLIVNGEKTRVDEHPWHSIIFRKYLDEKTRTTTYKYICGGTLISYRESYFILSAAHCFTDFKKGNRELIPEENFQIQIGATSPDYYSNLDNPETQTFNAYNISISPAYYFELAEGDIAIIELNCPVHLSRYVIPICFPFDKAEIRELINLHTQIGYWGTVVGFGINENGTLSQSLMKVSLPIANRSDCTIPFGRPPSISQLCIGTEQDNKSVCNGDSGSGLVFQEKRFYINGIVSSGPERGVCKGFAIFTKVLSYSGWAFNIMKKDDLTMNLTFRRYNTFCGIRPPQRPPLWNSTTFVEFDRIANRPPQRIPELPISTTTTTRTSSSTIRPYYTELVTSKRTTTYPTRVSTYPTRVSSTTRTEIYASSSITSSTQSPSIGQPNNYEYADCGLASQNSGEISDQAASLAHWPWTISLSSRTFNSEAETKCGAALLHKNFVITSANCVEWTLRNPRDLVATLGSRRSHPRKVDRIILHPGYKAPSAPLYEYSEKNIALLKLEPVSENSIWSKQTPICLPSYFNRAFVFSSSDLAIVTGWNNTGYQEQLGLHFFPQDRCRSFFSKESTKRSVTNLSICTGGGGAYSTGICSGDGGSPLIIQRESDSRYELIGILSVYDFCNFWSPIIFARIAFFTKWISRVISTI